MYLPFFVNGDDETYLAFIFLTKDTGRFDLNPEEKKFRIKGSSTRQVFFNTLKVPLKIY